MNKRYIFLLVIIILHLLSNSSFCYDDAIAHPRITIQAISYSKLSDVLPNNLGITDGINKTLKNTITNETYPIYEWLWRGSKIEDTPLCRASNHFHDPLKSWDVSYMTDVPLANTYCSSKGWTAALFKRDLGHGIFGTLARWGKANLYSPFR